MYLGSERKKLRLPEYNYSEAGWYFVTICVKNQECCFGGVQKDIMCLNEYGTIVQKCWYDIVYHYAGITLDEFIIMPNHVHGIIVIEDGVTTVGARHAWPLRMRTQMPSTILRPYQKLPIVVGSFKSAVSKIIHLLFDGDCFQWQRSFYDEIIKSESHLNNARQYIWDKPSRWDRDHNIITEKMFRK